MSSSVREVEVLLPSAGSYIPAWVTISANEAWSVSPSKIDDKAIPCNALEPGSSIRIAPMTRQYGGWNEEHFHSSLRLPLECSPGQGVTVLLEALASECVAVALSPESGFVMGKTYVVHFGASGNIATVIRRRLPSASEAVDVQFAGRACSEDSWITYWLCLVGGKLYVGVGKVPGQQCIGLLDDTLYNQLRSGVDAVRYVGIGNSAVGRSVRPLKVRNVVVSSVPEGLRTSLESLVQDDLPMINVDEEKDEETKTMMQAYKEECIKAKSRAAKFGIPYKEPDPQAFLNWSKARKLRANPQKGFATGMDISTPEELDKQRARAERFGIVDNKRGREEEEQQGTEERMEEDALPISEAWDNEELTRPHRTDPPKELWLKPPEDAVEEENYAMEDAGPASLTPEKIHICSIDWSAFKQIRTDDVLAYFSNFGPSYVEWLGEISCNVLFEDKFSASRALQNLSQPLPSPPPDEVVAKFTEAQPPDFGKMGWALCQHPIRKIANDRFGRRGTTARVLMRVAASTDLLLQKPLSTPKPPPGFSTKRILGPGSDFDTEHRRKRQRREAKHEEREEGNTYPDGDHPLLGQGLRSGRDGYSIEEMQAERAQSHTVEGI